MSKEFGAYLRKRREELLKGSSDYSVRKVAARIEIQPSYVSKVERGEVAPPSEATIVRWAEALGEDPDVPHSAHPRPGEQLLQQQRNEGSLQEHLVPGPGGKGEKGSLSGLRQDQR